MARVNNTKAPMTMNHSKEQLISVVSVAMDTHGRGTINLVPTDLQKNSQERYINVTMWIGYEEDVSQVQLDSLY